MNHDPESTLPEQEKFTDDSDRATDIEMRANNYHVHQARLRARQEQQPRADGSYETTDCVECDEPIGERRLQIATMNFHCVDCATARERRR